ERDPDVVDARDPPVPRLDHDVHSPAFELRQPQLEPVVVEPLPRDARLDGDVLVADPPVAGDQVEAEAAQVPRLDLAELRRDEVVVEEVHLSSLPVRMDSPSLLSPWSFEPLQVVPTVVVAVLYARRTRTLEREGRPVPRWRRAMFWTGIAF